MKIIRFSCLCLLFGLMGAIGSYGCKRVTPPQEIQNPLPPITPTTMPATPESAPASMPSTQPDSMPATQPAAESAPGTW